MHTGGDIAHGRRCCTDMQEGGDIAHGRGRRTETHAGDAGSVGARTTPAGGGAGGQPEMVSECNDDECAHGK